MRVFVAGATGAIGRCLLPMLVRRGHEVTGSTRSGDSVRRIEEQGAAATVCDVFDHTSLGAALDQAKPEVVVNQLTSIPKRIDPRRIGEEMQATNKLRTEGTEALLSAAEFAGARCIVTQSISFCYAPGSDQLATEDQPLYRDAPPGFGGMIEAVARSEELVLSSNTLAGIVLRYGFFYGPGTIYASDGSFAEDVRSRRIPVIGRGNGMYSFVHVDDAAFATTLAIEDGRPGIYNVVDDEPATFSDWLPDYAELLGAPRPMRVPEVVGRLAGGPYVSYLTTELRGACNHKAKQRLQWKPRYASWRDGFRAALQIQ